MKMITLYEPWATFILWGWKKIETRTHRNYKHYLGETIGIHAAKTFDEHSVWQLYMNAEQYLKFQDAYHNGHFKKTAGKIICTADVFAEGLLYPAHSKDAMVYCNPEEDEFKRYGLHLIDIKELKEYVPAKGKPFPWEFPLDSFL